MTVKAAKKRDQKRKPDAAAHLNALPNTYKFAAEALKKMSERGGSAGSIVVNNYKSYNYKLIYALVMNTVKNIKLIKKLIHNTKLANKVSINDPFQLEILVGDLLFGRGLKSLEQNTIAAAIIGHRDAIVKQRDLLKDEFKKSDDSGGAKYLRINHLKTTPSHVITQLTSVGLKQVEYQKDKIKFKKFINKFKSLEDNEFMVDFHFPDDLIVLKGPAADKLKKIDLLRKGKAMLQDKASFMAIEALDVKQKQVIIDACCAPGCKTSLIADKLKNKGKILGFDLDKKRLLTAKHMLKIYGVNCASLQVQDFSKLKLRRLLKANNTDQFDSILIDPSCSGSGIKSRLDYKTSKDEEGRLKKLQAFQVSLLRHALKSNATKSIVYCTCSTSTIENEQVIEMALRESGVQSLWDIVEIIPYWPHRGDQNFEFGAKCIRSDADNLTNGFFIAKFIRNSQPFTGKQLDEEDSAPGDPSPVNKKARVGQSMNNQDDEDEICDEETEDQDDQEDDDDDDDDDDEENEDEDLDEESDMDASD